MFLFSFQVLFVNRGQADARQDVREQIKARACDVTQTKNGLSWRQLFVFPEGTTTNGRTLIKFKTGAFQVRFFFYFRGSLPHTTECVTDLD